MEPHTYICVAVADYQSGVSTFYEGGSRDALTRIEPYSTVHCTVQYSILETPLVKDELSGLYAGKYCQEL